MQEFDVVPTVCAAVFGVMAFLEAAAQIVVGLRMRLMAAAATRTAPRRAAAFAAIERLARVTPFALAIRPRATEEASALSGKNLI